MLFKEIEDRINRLAGNTEPEVSQTRVSAENSLVADSLRESLRRQADQGFLAQPLVLVDQASDDRFTYPRAYRVSRMESL